MEGEREREGKTEKMIRTRDVKEMPCSLLYVIKQLESKLKRSSKGTQ